MIDSDWNDIRAAVQYRDRERCMNCHRDSNDLTYDVHHIVPRRHGGSDQLSNLVLLCRRCHDAAHGNAKAPRAEWYTNGEMPEDVFGLYTDFFRTFDITRFDGDTKSWYIPQADLQELVERFHDGTSSANPTSLADFM